MVLHQPHFGPRGVTAGVQTSQLHSHLGTLNFSSYFGLASEWIFCSEILWYNLIHYPKTLSAWGNMIVSHA